MTGQATYKHQIAIDLFLEKHTLHTFFTRASFGNGEKGKAIRKPWFGSDIARILLLYKSTDEHLEILRGIYHYLQTSGFREINLYEGYPNNFEKSVIHSIRMYLKLPDTLADNLADVSEEDIAETLFSVSMMIMNEYITEYSRLLESIIVKQSGDESCIELLQAEFGFNLGIDYSQTEQTSFISSTDPLELRKVDISLVLRSFQNAGQNVNAHKFAESFGFAYDESMKRMKGKVRQKNERIYNIIEMLTEHLSAEEKNKLAAKLRA